MVYYRGFVIAISKQEQVLGVRAEPFHRRVDDGIQVAGVVVFGANVLLASPWVAFALHQTKKVTVDDDPCIAALCLLKVIGQQTSIAMGIIPVQVGDKKKLLPRLAGYFVDVALVLA